MSTTNLETETQQPQFDFEIDWFGPPELDNSWRDTRKEQEIKDCGSFKYFYSAKTGMNQCIQIRCKHWADCPQCRAWKIGQEKELLESLVKKGVKKVIVSKEEEDKLTRKYGKEKVRRIPIGENGTAFIIDTEDEIGEPLTMDDCESLAKHAIPEAGRRMSGSLGSVSSPVLSDKDKERIEEEEIRKDIYDPRIEIEIQEAKIEFNSEDDDAPTDWKALGKQVRKEADIIKNPNQSKEELQAAIKKLENKTQEICLRYGMSFSFYRGTKETLRLSEVNWQWVKMKQEKLILA